MVKSMYRPIEDIEIEYNGNFVCIANCRIGEYHDVIGGEVIAVSKDKMEVQKIWSTTPESYYRWMGDFPDEMRYLLL